MKNDVYCKVHKIYYRKKFECQYCNIDKMTAREILQSHLDIPFLDMLGGVSISKYEIQSVLDKIEEPELQVRVPTLESALKDIVDTCDNYAHVLTIKHLQPIDTTNAHKVLQGNPDEE